MSPSMAPGMPAGKRHDTAPAACHPPAPDRRLSRPARGSPDRRPACYSGRSVAKKRDTSAPQEPPGASAPGGMPMSQSRP